MKNVSLLTLFFVCTLTGTATEVWSDPDESLILYLSFDELSGRTLKDHSEYKNNGELVGKPTLVEGKFGKALKFNGRSDWVEIPHDESLTVDKSVTVMAWIKTPRHGGPNGALWQSIVAKGNNPRSYSFYTDMESGGVHLSINNFIGGHSRRNIALNRWQHVAAQVDNRLHRYWINGKLTAVYLLDASLDASLPGKADTASVRVGNSHDIKPAVAADRHFRGLIDELRIWNRALSQDEIIREMQTGNKSVQNTKDASEARQSSEKK